MSTVLGEREFAPTPLRRAPWIAAAAGLAALYVPTYVSLAQTLWRDEAYSHGPIILIVFAWLVWRERARLLEPSRPNPVAGFLVLAAGLVLYAIGRAFALPLFEVASHIPVLAGVVLVLRGVHALRRLAFAFVFLAFLIPIPGFILDWATGPLKTVVSIAVTAVLQFAGYDVVREGVVLDLGGRQMLVADACSGLNSIHSLFALALLYAWLTPPRSAARAMLLLLVVVPIAIVANVVRVTILVLLAHRAGDDVAQGFLHGFAGIVVFLVSLALLLGLDRLIAWKAEAPSKTERFRVFPPEGGQSLAAAIAMAVLMAGTALATPFLKPQPSNDANLDLERVIPAQFGDWRVDPEVVPIAPTPDVQANLDRLYRQVVSRTYANSAGQRMMLTVAYGGDQSDALKAHRQEKCYEAQGFQIVALEHGTLPIAQRTIPVTRMVAVRGERIEPVTYWFTMGERVVLGRAERLHTQIAAGLEGRVPDGMLVRVSSISPGASQASFAAQQRFAGALFASVAAADLPRFIGARPD
jgi:exosortase B